MFPVHECFCKSLLYDTDFECTSSLLALHSWGFVDLPIISMRIVRTDLD